MSKGKKNFLKLLCKREYFSVVVTPIWFVNEFIIYCSFWIYSKFIMISWLEVWNLHKRCMWSNFVVLVRRSRFYMWDCTFPRIWSIQRHNEENVLFLFLPLRFSTLLWLFENNKFGIWQHFFNRSCKLNHICCFERKLRNFNKLCIYHAYIGCLQLD